MASLRNGHTNGSAKNGVSNGIISPVSKRFSDIPSAIDIPVQGAEDEEQAVEVDLEELLDDPTELCTLLENEGAARTHWMTVSLAYAKQKKVDHAIEMLLKGQSALRGGPKEKLSMLSCLCWLYLWKSREAPRVAPDGVLVSEARTKEFYLQQSTTTLNDASRINPAFPPLFLARGVLYLLRASLQPPSRSSAPGALDPEKAEILRHALKSFEDAIRVSQGRNMMAVLGRSRAYFSLGKFAEALDGYQEVLHKMPELTDPDPRIGIGCCFWQLGFKDDAKTAWERALEVTPGSKTANTLLGLYFLDASARVPANGPEFVKLYKKAITEYTQKSFKADKDMPLTCATFASYFLTRKSFRDVDTLAHKAIQYTDVNAIASDGWYLLARAQHFSGDFERANDFYRRADEARGGADRGYLPAKFGSAQLSVLNNDFGEAKLRLEKMTQQSKNVEAMTLLGTLYAEEVFANQYSSVKEDKSTELKKAIGYLENVRTAWKDPKKNLTADASVLLNLARLYEADHPERSLQCLQQVEQLEIDRIPDEDKPEGVTDDAELRASMRQSLPPQLLNNIGCFHYQAGKFDFARDMFQAALSACVKVGEKEEELDTDALVTTISYNLGRTYEANGLLDEANTVYEGLLSRHNDYTDARTRMAYIALRQKPSDEGPKAVTKLYQDAAGDLEVRALYGWYLGRVLARKRTPNVNEDPELRHYKHTLQSYEKHDRYALIGMGNLYLQSAREMRRETDQEKQKRSGIYGKAVEFFDKALQLDPKNAYAAQGIAIALVEDKKDSRTGLGIFASVRETIKDHSVYVNLGHVFAELRQYSKAIENYEAALSKDRAHDSQILACLGRAWLTKARAERSLEAYQNALDYSQKALAVAPEQIHYKFNIAFVQIQLATAIYNTSESQRTLAQLQAAAAGLEEAIASLDAIAQQPLTPYPRHDVEQRANMARNTMRRQLERAVQSQREHEERNREKMQQALELRSAELARREAARREAEAREAERKRLVAEDRARMQEQARALAEQRADEDRAREAAEYTEDEETGERVKRGKKKAAGGKAGAGTATTTTTTTKRKKKENDDDDDNDSGVDDDSGAGSAAGGADKPKKKRRLASKREPAAPKRDRNAGKYKSSEMIIDSDDELDDGAQDAEKAMDDEDEDDGFGGADGDGGRSGKGASNGNGMDVDDDDEGAGAGQSDEEAAAASARSKRKSRARIVESEDEDDEDDNGGGGEDGGGDGEKDKDRDEDAAPLSGGRSKAVIDDDDDDDE